MDLTAIQEKLRRQAQLPALDNLVLPRDWPPAQSVMMGARDQAAPSTAQLGSTVETLRRRSLRSLGPVPSPSASAPMANHSGDHGASLNQMAWQQQLRMMAEKINRLSHEQEITIAALAMTGAQLLDSPPSPEQRFPIPRIDLKHAVTATATLDGQGNVCLTYKPVHLESLDQTAHQLSAQLRQRYGLKHRRGARSFPFVLTLLKDLRALIEEPLVWCGFLGRKLLRLGFVQPTPTGASTPGITPVVPSLIDTLLWIGSGAIARLVLNLFLSAFPGFWSLSVLGITALLAYALYNATLAARPNLGVATRVGLLVVGLGLGGYI